MTRAAAPVAKALRAKATLKVDFEPDCQAAASEIAMHSAEGTNVSAAASARRLQRHLRPRSRHESGSTNDRRAADSSSWIGSQGVISISVNFAATISREL